MVTQEKLIILTQQILETLEKELFLVEINLSNNGAIEVIIDSDTRVSIEQCVKISRSIEQQMEKQWGEEIMQHHSLLVTSAGIGYPLKHNRQLLKCKEKPIAVIMNNGEKITGTLENITTQNITIMYHEKQNVEGKKKKEMVQINKTIEINQTKSITELLTIK